MIVSTAGHVDHGKTALVRALTGIDTDRLPEEKARNLTIDLGFAYIDIGGRRIGFVDVPGHERFVRNMTAGVAAIDFVLLTVAADDGPMPQTAEHLAILDLLGISNGVVAITKIDRTGQSRVEEVAAATRSLIDGTTLHHMPVIPVSAHNGDGIGELRKHLTDAADKIARRPTNGNFRLAIDRAFTVRGAGLTVTGAVYSGEVGIGDQLLLSPQEIAVRVRGVHTNGQEDDHGAAGDRCAINITGAGGDAVDGDLIERGDWLLAPPAHAPTKRFDARARLLAGEPEPLQHWSPVHVHTAAAHSTGRIALLESTSFHPDTEAYVQLVLDQPVGILHGDRMVLRDASARRTIGGGEVLDPFASGRGRARPERHAILRILDSGTPDAALANLLEISPRGVNLDRFARARNLTPDEADRLWSNMDMHRFGKADELTGISGKHYLTLQDDITNQIDQWHTDNPSQLGPNEQQLQRKLRPLVGSALLNAGLRDLCASGAVVREGTIVHRPDHKVTLSGEDRTYWENIAPIYDLAGDRPPRIREISAELGLPIPVTDGLLARISHVGLLTRVSRNRYFMPSTLRRLAMLAEQLAAESPEHTFQPAEYRDASGIGRNLTIELLEYFDQTGFTRRRNGGRVILAPVTDIFGSDSAVD